jgi:type I restriction enzyme S subunit
MKHSWRLQKIGDLFEFKYGKGLTAEHRQVGGSVKVYGSNGIIGQHDQPLSKGPTIIVGRKGSVGEINFSPAACWPIDTTYYIDDFPDGFPPKYWALYLKSLRLGSHDKSSAIPGVSRKDIYCIGVPVPPLNEQRRIVAKLEKLLARVDVCQERLNKISVLLKRFRQSVLAAACSGRLTADWRETHIKDKPIEKTEILANGLPDVPETWCWVKLPKTGEMSRGKSRHRPRNAPFLLGGSYPFIQTGDIAQSGGRITSHKHTYSEAGLAQSRLWPAKTVCITIAANIAESALLTYPACFPDSVVGIITDRSKCLPEFLEFFVRTAKSDLSTFAPATAQKNINIKILSDVLVPLPPLPEQQEIVRRVEDLFKIADQIEERYKRAKAHIDKLTQSILAKAFRGELVRQDPNDEPASVLLECTRSSKIADSPISKAVHTRSTRGKA